MSPTNIYLELQNLYPGISVKAYKQHKLRLNTIWFQPETGGPMIFTYIGPNNYCLRTERYEREANK